MEQFKQFNLEKNEVIQSLNGLKGLVGKLEDVGIDSFDALNKIESSIQNIEDDTLRIALLGAFSDGKTSVIAGWLGQIMNNMKIDSDESSNELAIYHPDNLPEKCEIIDTPGLFGDKTQTDERGQTIQFSDLTRKYISEAHLIFYVVDATNPLKESHKDTVQWILRDLNKISSTVFIINKMDEVADLRDPDEFEQQAKIKTDNLVGKLERFIQLTAEERKKLNIVCLASNPNGRGLDFWFGKKDIYEDRSRINSLKQITTHILSNTAKDTLIKKTGLDVVKDIVTQNLELAEQQYSGMDLYIQNTQTDIINMRNDIERGRNAFINAKQDLVSELTSLERNLLGNIRALNQENVKSFVECEIGHTNDDTGYKLRLTIEQTCEKHFRQSANILNDLRLSIEHQLDNSEKFANSITKHALSASTMALKQVSKLPVSTIKTGVFAARNTLSSITGASLKFKPWGATKLAAGIGKWAGPIGLGIQVFADYREIAQQQKAEEDLLRLHDDLANLVCEHFKAVYDLLSNNEKAITNFAPQFGQLQELLKAQEDDLNELKRRKTVLGSIREDFQKMAASGITIDANFRVVS